MTDAASPRNTLVRPIPLGHANAFLIRGSRPILVDTGLPGNAPKILAALQEEGYKPWDLALIIITHVHIDHFGSAAALAGATSAPVLVHSSEADALTTGATLPAVPASLLGRMLALMIGKHTPAPELAIKPVIGSMPRTGSMRSGSMARSSRPRAIPGDRSRYRLATGEVIIGDLVMGMLPAHKPRLPLFAEDMDAAKKSILTILDARPTVIYTGHGGPFTCDQLEALL